jgi:hypothetical protein
LFESRTAGTFKPGASAPIEITPEARVPGMAAGMATAFMVLSDGDVVGYYTDLPSAVAAADRWEEEYDRRVKIFAGDRVLSKGEIETARSHAEVSHSVRATKKSPLTLDREIAELVPSWRRGRR